MISNQLIESCCFGRIHSFFFFSAWYIVGEFSVLFYSDCFDRIKLHGIPLKFFVIFFSFLFYFLVFYFFFFLAGCKTFYSASFSLLFGKRYKIANIGYFQLFFNIFRTLFPGEILLTHNCIIRMSRASNFIPGLIRNSRATSIFQILSFVPN